MARGVGKWPRRRVLAHGAALATACAVAMGAVDAAGSTSSGGASASFVLERNANTSTTSSDAIQVDFVVAPDATGGETEQQIAFDAQQTALWNLSSWNNVIAQLDNAIANNDLALDVVQLDVRFNETAQPSQLHLTLDEQWEYGPTLAFSNGSLAGLTQLSALYVTGFNVSISDANWLPEGVYLDQIILESTTLESFDVDSGANISDFVIRNSNLSAFPAAILALDSPVSKIILEFNNISGPIKLTTSQVSTLEELDVVANSNTVDPTTSSECKKTDSVHGLAICVVASDLGDGFTTPTSDSSGSTRISSDSESDSSSATTPLTTNTSSSGSSGLSTAVIVLACVCAGVLVVGAAFFRKLKERMNKYTSDQLTFSSQEAVFISPGRDTDTNGNNGSASVDERATGASVSAAAVKAPNEAGILPEFDLGTDKVTPQKKMGANGLWRATYEERKVVVLKLNPRALHLSFKKLNAALETYAPLKHPNIVQFLGACLTSMDDVLIVVELLEKGNLRSVLADTKTELSWTQRIQMGADIANGLAFLRRRTPPSPISYHLTTKSVLCSAELTCKLDVFEYAEAMRDSRTPVMAFGDGDIVSRAPELLSGGKITEAAEVYAFGVILCEISLRHRVFDDILDEQGPTLGDILIAKEVVAGRKTPEPASDAPDALRDVVARCVAREPSERPTAEEIASLLASAVGENGGSAAPPSTP